MVAALTVVPLLLFRGAVSPGGSSGALTAATPSFLATNGLVTEGTLTKAALVEQVVDVADLTKKRAEDIVETVFASIAEALRREENVELRGFGSFRLRRREPRRGCNPRTGDRVDVASKHVAYFTPGKELKELINRDPPSPSRRRCPSSRCRTVPPTNARG